MRKNDLTGKPSCSRAIFDPKVWHVDLARAVHRLPPWTTEGFSKYTTTSATNLQVVERLFEPGQLPPRGRELHLELVVVVHEVAEADLQVRILGGVALQRLRRLLRFLLEDERLLVLGVDQRHQVVALSQELTHLDKESGWWRKVERQTRSIFGDCWVEPSNFYTIANTARGALMVTMATRHQPNFYNLPLRPANRYTVDRVLRKTTPTVYFFQPTCCARVSLSLSKAWTWCDVTVSWSHASAPTAAGDKKNANLKKWSKKQPASLNDDKLNQIIPLHAYPFQQLSRKEVATTAVFQAR